MSYYNITILVTAEQEEAIIDLYKAKCWVYLKSGEEPAPTEFLEQPDKQALSDTYTNGLCGFPLKPDLSSNMNYEEKASIENAYEVVKTEVGNYLDDNEDITAEENKEVETISGAATEASLKVSNLAVHTEGLQHNEDDIISNSETSESPLERAAQKSKTGSIQSKRTKLPCLRKQNDTKNKCQGNAKTLVTKKMKENRHDRRNREKRETTEAAKLKLKAEHSAKAVSQDSEDENKTKEQPLRDEPSQSSMKSYECEICHKVYERAGCLVRHRATHAGEKRYSYQCEKCGESFPRKKLIEAHMATHNRESVHTCETCGKSYSKRHTLQLHMALHSDNARLTCDVCGKHFLRAWQLKRHVSERTCSRRFSCQTCGKSFRWLQILKNHVLTHTGEKPRTCETCGKSFSSDTGFRYHMGIHSDTVLKCDYCEKTFKRQLSLRAHLVVHTREKRYTCDICGQAFGHHWSLRFHLRKHSGERPYTCQTCGKTFVRSSGLRKHMFVHEPEKLYRCLFCKNVFWVEDNLNKHVMLKHTEDNTTNMRAMLHSVAQANGP